VRKSTSEAHEHFGYGRTSSAWLPRLLVVPTWNGTTLCRATMCSPRLSSSLHPCYRNNHKCGLWTGGWIGTTGCGEAPSEAHDISVPWPMELKLRELRPGVTPYGCPRGGPNSKDLGLALVNRSCRSCFPGRCQQHEISWAGWPARPGVQCDGGGEGLGAQVSCNSPEITLHDIQTAGC